MDKKRAYLIGGLISIIIVISIVVPITLRNNPQIKPIIILNDDDFVRYNFPGNGSKENPFVIKNYNIETTEENAISISYTTKYFIIQDCKLKATMNGILLRNVSDGTGKIIQNNCSNQFVGISLFGSSNITIKENICNNNNYGIRVGDSRNGSIICNNTCDYNIKDGIFLQSSNKVIMENNSCKNNDNGFHLQYSNNTILENNTCSDNNYGIFLDIWNIDTMMLKNKCNNNTVNGVFVNRSVNTTIINNLCKRNYENGIYLLISDAFLTGNNCSNNNNNGIYLDAAHFSVLYNNRFENNSEDGIYLDSTQYVILENNTINYNNHGAFLSHSDNNYIAKSTFCLDSIYLYYSDNNVIVNNSLTSISMGSSIFVSQSNNASIINNFFNDCGLYIRHDSVEPYLTHRIENNWINNKKLGYFASIKNMTIVAPLYRQLILINCSEMLISNQELVDVQAGLSIFYCRSIILTNNTCSNNQDCGIKIIYSTDITIKNNTIINNDAGIRLEYYSNRIIVDNNTISNNRSGIRIVHGPSYCNFTYNYFWGNSMMAIMVYSHTYNSTFHHNTFFLNNLGGLSQASDDAFYSTWYDVATNEGNFWSDWSGSGVYSIGGSANSIDPYPLSSPPTS